MQFRWFALAAVLVLAALGVWWFVELEPSPARAPLPTPESEQESPARMPDDLEALGTHSRVETSAASAAGATARPPKDAKHPSATIRARCLDENAQPIADVELLGDGMLAQARSGADGRIDGQLKLWTSEGSLMQLELRERFHLRFSEARSLVPDAVCDLGDVVLARAGRILGRVVDEHGAPLAKAEVWSARIGFSEWKHATEQDSAWAASAEDGGFVLDSVPCGATRVVAHTKGYAPAERSPLEVRAGEELREVVVALSEHVAEAQTQGFVVRVHAPSGATFPTAELVYSAHEAGGGSSGNASLDAQGTHTIACGPEARVNVRARDPSGHYAAACAFELPGSQGSVDLVLGETSAHTLLATDEQGQPVESYTFRALEQAEWTPFENRSSTDEHGLLLCTLPDPGSNGSIDSHSSPAEAHPGGRAELRLPPGAFVVQVDAPDCALAEFGPFDSASAPAELHVQLQRQPGIRGVVTVDGKPTGGAWVRLFEAVNKRELLVYDMPSRVLAQPLLSSTSAADGSFLLPLRFAGEYELQAGSAGRGIAELGPLHLDPAAGAKDLVLELPAFGAIEGHVLVNPGAALRDLIVGASRADGHPLSVRTDAEGRFRFEKLSPGRWLLRLVREEIDPRSESTELRDTPPPGPLPFSCEVRANETTSFDIDLRQTAELVARIEIAGWEQARWQASLEPQGATQCRGASIEGVDPEHLRLKVDQPGDYFLRLSATIPGAEPSLGFDETLHLEAGTNIWNCASQTGGLVLANHTSGPLWGYLLCHFAGGRVATIGARIPAHAELALPRIPVGTWTRVSYRDGQGVEEGSTEVTSAAPGRVEWNP